MGNGFSDKSSNDQQLCYYDAIQNLDFFQIICKRFNESLDPKKRDQSHLYQSLLSKEWSFKYEDLLFLQLFIIVHLYKGWNNLEASPRDT